MRVAASRQTGDSSRRVELRFSNFVMGDGRPSTYWYVFFLKDESGDMQEKDGAIHRTALEAVPSREVRNKEQHYWTSLVETHHGWGTRDKYDTARLLSDWVFSAEGRVEEETEAVYRPMLNACFKLATPMSATEIAGGHYARDLDAVVQGYVQSDSSTDRWARLRESLRESIDSLHGRDDARTLRAYLAQLSQFFERDREVRIKVEASVVSPSALADLVVQTHEDSDHWLDSFAEQLFRRLSGVGLKRILRVWNLDGQDAADGFGVSEETLEFWLRQGVPADVAEPMADLSAATDLLLHYLKVDRIPAVVRRPAERLGGKSLVDLYSERKTADILKACRDMFRFEDVHA